MRQNYGFMLGATDPAEITHTRVYSTDLGTIVGVHVLQSIWTVAFDHSRTKMPLPCDVSAHKPLGTP